MKRPTKEEIRKAVEKLKEPKEGSSADLDYNAPKPQEKKGNKQRIRKKGV